MRYVRANSPCRGNMDYCHMTGCSEKTLVNLFRDASSANNLGYLETPNQSTAVYFLVHTRRSILLRFCQIIQENQREQTFFTAKLACHVLCMLVELIPKVAQYLPHAIYFMICGFLRIMYVFWHNNDCCGLR